MDKLVEHGIRMLEIIDANDIPVLGNSQFRDIARAVYDVILRVQMLERKADRKTEPSNSEIPNNCEHITEDGVTCAKYPACDDCLDNPLNKVKGSEGLVKGSEQTEDLQDWKDRMWAEAIVTEPTSSKMEQVDKDINVRSKDEPTTQTETQNSNLTFEKADEPQTERKCIDCNFLTYMFGKTWCNIKCENPHDKVCDRFKAKDEPHIVGKHADVIIIDEPQTKCNWCKFYDGEECYCPDDCDECKGGAIKDEPQTDEFELFDREALILLIECQKERIAELLEKDEPQTCEDCKHNGEKHAYDYACDKCTDMDKFQHEDEPQTQLTAKCLNCNNSKACKEKHWDGCVYEPIEDEPQTDLLVKTPRKSRESHEKADAPLTDAEITELAKEIVHEMIDNSVIAEDAYPGLRQRMHEAVERLDEYYPPEGERSE